MTNDSLILQHYSSFWGKYNKITIGTDNAHSVSVAEFEPNLEDQDWVYATVGMSKRPMPYPIDWMNEKPERRVELFIYSRKQNDELGNLLLSLANYPFIKNTFFNAGHTIPGTVGVVNDSFLTDILLLSSLGEPPEFEFVHYKNYHVRMLWVIPIFSSERQFILKNGWQDLVDLFYRNHTDTSNFHRDHVA